MPESISIMLVAKQWSSNSSFPPHLVVGFLLQGRAFVISLTCLYQCRLMDIYFILWIIMLFSNYLFWSSNCPRFGQWEPFQVGSCVLLTCLHHSLSTSLLPGMRCSRLILYFPWPNLEISHFSKEPWFHLVENNYFKSKIWVLALLISTGVSLTLALSVDRTKK